MLVSDPSECSGASPWASVIIVAYNSGDHLQECVDALALQSMDEFEAIIVDNASTDGAVRDLRLPDHRFRIVPAGRNLGFAGGCNLGMRMSHARWIAMLNPDTVPKSDWLEALLQAAGRHPGITMFGSTQISARDETVFDGTGDAYSALGVAFRGNYRRSVSEKIFEGETFGPCAAAALYRADALRRVGGFDERYFCYYEDVDLAFRLRLMGERCIQVPDAVVHHVGSTIEEANADFILYHSYRNQLWTFVKNMPGPLFWLLLPAHLGWTALTLARRGKFRLPARGVWDGMRGLGPILQSRREIQSGREVSWLTIARAFTWWPGNLFTMRADIRQVPTTM